MSEEEPSAEPSRTPQERAPRPGGKPAPSWRCADEIEPKPVYWTWRPYVPQGMLTVLEGDPGLGKSWLTLEMAARMTRGEALPNSIALRPRSVLIMNAEDSAEHTLVPRLQALGADLTKVHLADRAFPLDADGIKMMREILSEVSAGLVFIDPIVAYMGASTDIHRANEVREVMAALSSVAEESGASIIAVRHLRKSGKGDSGKALYAGAGSIDFSASARSILQMEQGSESHIRVLRHIKCNVGPLGSPLAFTFEDCEEDGPDGAPVIYQRLEWVEGWEEPTPEPSGPQVSRTPRADHAKKFLRELLADGPRTSKEVYEAAEANGLKSRTLKKAKQEVAVSFKAGETWYWELATEPDPESVAPSDAILDPRVLEEAQARLARSKGEDRG